MKKRLIKVVSTSFLLLSFCIFSHAEAVPTDYFNGIQVSGNFIVHVYPAHQRRVYLENIAEPCVNFSVEDQVLRIELPKAVQSQIDYPVEISIGVPYLNYVATDGNAVVRGNHVQSAGLTLIAAGDSQINLTGHLNVKRIDAHDDSDIALRWVSGSNVTVSADGGAQVTMAGNVNVLQAALQGGSCLHAKYLRSKVILVHTMQRTIATVFPLQSLYAFATDRSNIYYYTDPHYTLTDTHISGNVLQLGHWQ
jgi:hypothetical protein